MLSIPVTDHSDADWHVPKCLQLRELQVKSKSNFMMAQEARQKEALDCILPFRLLRAILSSSTDHCSQNILLYITCSHLRVEESLLGVTACSLVIL